MTNLPDIGHDSDFSASEDAEDGAAAIAALAEINAGRPTISLEEIALELGLETNKRGEERG